jgi:hypothetical protein
MPTQLQGMECQAGNKARKPQKHCGKWESLHAKDPQRWGPQTRNAQNSKSRLTKWHHGWGQKWGKTENRLQETFGADRNVKKLDYICHQLCKFTKKHWKVHLKWVNFMAWRLCVNKAVLQDPLGSEENSCNKGEADVWLQQGQLFLTSQEP